jgi:hypothetical protein
MDKKQYRCVGINFPPKTLDQIDQLAEARGVSRTEVVRTAISVALPLMQLGIAINTRRTLAILEHTQLALSLLVERDSPEDAAELLRLAFQNVDAHHG